MQRFLEKKVDLKAMSPLALAFMGDAIYSAFVREYLVTKANSTVKRLHSLSVGMVRCEFQSRIINEVLLDILTNEEKDVYTRGRNAKVGHVPKNSSVADYHASTGFEVLFGYLYLKGELSRLQEIFEIIVTQWESTT